MLLTNTINAKQIAKATYAGIANACGCELRSESAHYVSLADDRSRDAHPVRRFVRWMCGVRDGGLPASCRVAPSGTSQPQSSPMHLTSAFGFGRVS